MTRQTVNSEPAGGTGPTSVWRVVRTSPRLAWLLPAMFLSVMTTGMTAIALAWLVLSIAPPAQGGLWVAGVLIATYVPGLAASTLLQRYLAHWAGSSLVVLDSVTRAGFMALIGALAATGQLTPLLTVGLVVCAAVTTPWGRGGVQAVIAQLVRREDRLAVNSWAMSQAAVAMIIGPALGGVVAGAVHPSAVLLADTALRLVVAAIVGLRVRSAPNTVPGGRGPTRGA